jgi:hypothetical protein
MLSNFCCSMTCLKWLRLLNEPLKKSCVVFILWKHYCGFLLDALFGLTWRMLTTCLTLTSHHKPLWLFGFWLVIPLYASVYDVLSLALLVGRSQSFASPSFCTEYELYSCIQLPKTKLFQCVHHTNLLAICYSKYIWLAFIYSSN